MFDKNKSKELFVSKGTQNLGNTTLQIVMDKETGKMSSAPLEKMAPFMPDDLQQQCIYRP